MWYPSRRQPVPSQTKVRVSTASPFSNWDWYWRMTEDPPEKPVTLRHPAWLRSFDLPSFVAIPCIIRVKSSSDTIPRNTGEAAAALLWRWRGHLSFVPSPRQLGGRPEACDALYAFMPLVLAVHLGVPLLMNGMNHTLFSPNNGLEGIWAHLFSLGQIGLALGFF